MRDDSEHRELWLQIPWYVNERIEPALRARMNTHLQDCRPCREELEQQRRVHAAMALESGVEILPSASLQKLRQRLDAAPKPSARREPRLWRWSAVAAGIIASGTLLSVMLFRTEPGAVFHTVSDVTTDSPQEAIRVVFSPQTTVERMQIILDDARVGVVAGPSEAGVYSLSLKEGQPVATALMRLRHQPEIRFAEVTAPEANPGRR